MRGCRRVLPQKHAGIAHDRLPDWRRSRADRYYCATLDPFSVCPLQARSSGWQVLGKDQLEFGVQAVEQRSSQLCCARIERVTGTRRDEVAHIGSSPAVQSP